MELLKRREFQVEHNGHLKNCQGTRARLRSISAKDHSVDDCSRIEKIFKWNTVVRI
jgi:hypothetical protein